VFAEPGHEEAKQLLAATYDELGYGAENGTWRNFYLMGALELRHGAIPPSLSLASPDLIQALTVEQLFDSIAIRVNGPKAWSQTLTIDWNFTDVSSRHRMTLSNGALIHWADPTPGGTDLTLTLTKPQLLGMLAGQGLEGIQTAGDPAVLERLLGLLDTPAPGFAIVTP
jgi:alkyl sulfatase BDS1-like metallo-beta-lactamase superfamily hydrolase